MHEIDETRASARDDQFEEILEKIKSVAEEFEEDEIPLYVDLGDEEYETGNQRIIKFSINKFEFLLTRNTEHYRVAGEGRKKHLEELVPPRINMKLKRRSQFENDWQVVDLEDLF